MKPFRLLFAFLLALLAIPLLAQPAPGLTRGAADARYPLRTQASILPQALRALGIEGARANPIPSGTAGAWLNNSGSFTGWGSTAVISQPTQAIGVFVQSWDAANPVTMVRLRVWTSDISASDPLVDRTVFVKVPFNTPTEIPVDLGRTLSTGTYFVAWNTDGRTGYYRRGDFTSPAGPPYYGYWNTTDVTAATFGTFQRQGSQVSAYLRFYRETPLLKVSSLAQPQATALGGGATNVFSGWRSGISARSDFNRAIVQAAWPNAADVPTSVRLVLKSGGASGTVVADRTLTNIDFGWVPGVYIPLVFDFEEDLPSFDFYEIYADGYIALRQVPIGTFPTASGYAATQYTTSATLEAPTWTTAASQSCVAITFEKWDNSRLTFAGDSDLLARLREKAETTPTPLLPRYLYAMEGQRSLLYFDAAISSPQGRASDRYQALVTCTRGSQTGRRWEYESPTSGEAGTATFTLDVYRQQARVATSTATLRTIALTAGGGGSRQIVTAGDSTWANGYVLAETKRILALGTNYTATFRGTLSVTQNDSASGSQTIRHDATSGWTLAQFATVGSPFFNGGATYDIPGYQSGASVPFTMASGDWVLINANINGLFLQKTDAEAWTYIAGMRTNMDAIIAAWKAAVPGIRIGIMFPMPPSVDADDFYGTTLSQTQWRYQRNRDMWSRYMLGVYDTAAQEALSVYVCPYGVSIDPDTGMADHVHGNATATGYYSLARTLAAFLKYHG